MMVRRRRVGEGGGGEEGLAIVGGGWIIDFVGRKETTFLLGLILNQYHFHRLNI